MIVKNQRANAIQPLPASQPTFRSSAVARMAHMPVSTLRIWEQRYCAVKPITAPSGHRQYSPADVERVLLLRQLTECGHAIGSIAALDNAQLQQVAQTQSRRPAAQDAHSIRQVPAMQVIVVGRSLALRLQRPAVLQRLQPHWQVKAVFDSLDEAANAAQSAPGDTVDLLLWQAPSLQATALPQLSAAQNALHAGRVAVTYRFAGTAATSAFAASGAMMSREPDNDEALGAWLASVQATLASHAEGTDSQLRLRDALQLAAGNITPRRYDDTTLTSIAGLSTTIACECPRHVAELLMQLSNFEVYSAECSNCSPADAELHAYLQRVAGASRSLFESALERVARHEGLKLP